MSNPSAKAPLFARRSIRKFLPEPVHRETVLKIIKAGMAAPSAGDEQPWEFIVVDDRETLNSITRFHPHAHMVTEAPVAILVCGSLERETHKGYWVQDCAAATQNMLIMATEFDLGSVWLGVYPREDRMAGCRNLFGLPEHIIPFALIPIGKAGETKPPRDRFDPDRICYNKWSKTSLT